MTESTDKPLLDEQQLDEYLKGDSSVSRQYRQLHSAEVPASLDRLVLRQAEDAVKNRTSKGRPAWVRWTAPLAVAASAVLVLSIVVETGLRDETAVLQAPQPTMQAKQRDLAESKAEEAAASEEAAPASGAAPPAQFADESASAEPLANRARSLSAPAVPVQDVAPVAPPPPKLDMTAPQMNNSAEPAAEASKRVGPVTDAQQPAEAESDEPQPFVQNRSRPPPVAAPARTAGEAPAIMPARSVSRAAEDAARVLNASSLEESARKQSANADEAKREDERLATQRVAPREVPAQMPPPRYEYTDPEAWLRDIRELRKENKQEQADREWRRFREAFPNYEVAESDSAREAKK